MSRVAKVIVLTVAALLLCVPVAGAAEWNVQQQDATVFVTRGASTTSDTISIYRKGGMPTAAQYGSGSYDETTGAGFFVGSYRVDFAVDVSSVGFSYRVEPGASLLVVLPAGAVGFTESYFFPADQYSKPVYLTQSVYSSSYSNYITSQTPIGSVLVSGVVPVAAQPSTVSIAGTVPVSIAQSVTLSGATTDAAGLAVQAQAADVWQGALGVVVAFAAGVVMVLAL